MIDYCFISDIKTNKSCCICYLKIKHHDKRRLEYFKLLYKKQPYIKEYLITELPSKKKSAIPKQSNMKRYLIAKVSIKMKPANSKQPHTKVYKFTKLSNKKRSAIAKQLNKNMSVIKTRAIGVVNHPNEDNSTYSIKIDDSESKEDKNDLMNYNDNDPSHDEKFKMELVSSSKKLRECSILFSLTLFLSIICFNF